MQDLRQGDGPKKQQQQQSSLELIQKFVDNQSKELMFKAQELEVEKQKDQNSLEYGKLALAAQERDRVHERECGRGEKKDQHRFIVWIAGVVALLIIAALFMDKDKIAEELVKVIVYIGAGVAAGYGLATRKKSGGPSSGSGQQSPE